MVFLISVLALVAFGALLVWRLRRRRALQRPSILIDGSNVMFWDGEVPKIETVAAVVQMMKNRGYRTGVMFDANVGYKLDGRYLGDAALARRLNLPVAQVLVVPKGTTADDYLLNASRRLSAPIVTNDRYRDWAESFPEVTTPGFLLRGGCKAGQVWVTGE